LHHSRQDIVNLLVSVCQAAWAKIQPYEEDAALTERLQLSLGRGGLLMLKSSQRIFNFLSSIQTQGKMFKKSDIKAGGGNKTQEHR